MKGVWKKYDVTVRSTYKKGTEARFYTLLYDKCQYIRCSAYWSTLNPLQPVRVQSDGIVLSCSWPLHLTFRILLSLHHLPPFPGRDAVGKFHHPVAACSIHPTHVQSGPPEGYYCKQAEPHLDNTLWVSVWGSEHEWVRHCVGWLSGWMSASM